MILPILAPYPNECHSFSALSLFDLFIYLRLSTFLTTKFISSSFCAMNEFQQINSFDPNGIVVLVFFLWAHTRASYARTVRICHRMCLWLFYYDAQWQWQVKNSCVEPRFSFLLFCFFFWNSTSISVEIYALHQVISN